MQVKVKVRSPKSTISKNYMKFVRYMFYGWVVTCDVEYNRGVPARVTLSKPGPVGRGRAGWHQRQLGVVPAERHVTPRGGVSPRSVHWARRPPRARVKTGREPPFEALSVVLARRVR